MKNQITHKYGSWIECLKKLESQIIKESQAPLNDVVTIEGFFEGTDFSGQNFTLTYDELRKISNIAFKHTLHDHGNILSANWESSYFKRFWGAMKNLRNQKLQILKTKQLDQIKYKYQQIEGE